MRAPVLSVLGELVVDLLPVAGADAGPEGTAPQYVARPGGNALNVAVAAGRLGARCGSWRGSAPDRWRANLRRHAELSGVDPAQASSRPPEPVSLAVVGLGPDGSPDYGFHVLGAADWQWTDDELAAVLPDRTGDPARRLDLQLDGARLRRDRPAGRAARRQGSALISVDPNIRPMLAEGPVGEALGNTAAVVRERLDRLVAQADVVKVSAEDLAWLDRTPTRPRRRRRARWADRGPALVLLTDGGAPLRIARPGPSVLHRRSRRGDGRRHGRRRRLARRRPAHRTARRRRHRPRRAGGTARRAAARAWWTTPRWSPPSTARGSAPTRPRARSSTPRARNR